MEFDWIDANFSLAKLPPKDIEESFEDPFAIKLLPDDMPDDADTRYFCLGKSLGNRPIFSVFWTDGKNYRVILARNMTGEELNFYERKNEELL